jgi:tetratricopeptide (TPR) repeat protein
MTAQRLAGLDGQTAERVVVAARALALGRVDQAAAALQPALAACPDHPEVLRLHAGVLNLQGQFPSARAAMQRAVELRPLDAIYHNTLGTILGSAGDLDAAIRALRRACELQPDLADAWYNLGLMLVRGVHDDEADHALHKAVRLDPANLDARALLADRLRVAGRIEEAASEYREVLTRQPWSGVAWWGLAELRTGTLDRIDVERMRRALHDSRASDDDHIAIGFSLARALDEQGNYRESLDALERANAIARLRQRWDATAFSAWLAAVDAAFTPPPPGATAQDLGREIVFIVGMPRSGTTLAEQILASHSQVAGSGELNDLPQVLAEASRRYGKPFPEWTVDMQPGDWQRLGERYLERTARWRRQRPLCTDKLPGNWMYVGAIRAMLPGAHVVVCRRDPLETCFSCYRQRLFNNEYSRTPHDLAAFWRDFDRSANRFAMIHPRHVYQHDYEALIANPEAGIRMLLDFCGLAFEASCLRFHETRRAVNSPSASQVRQPLRTGAGHVRRYGSLLDPFRVCLGLPRFQV